MSDLDILARIKIPRNNTAAMQLMMLYAQSGHFAWTSDTVKPDYVHKLSQKFHDTLHIGRAAHQRVYYKKKNEASVHLVALPDGAYVRWVLMSTRGKAGLLDRSISAPGVVRDLRARGEHLRWRHYEMFRMQKRFHIGGSDISTDETWSWRIVQSDYRAHEAWLVEHAKRHDRPAIVRQLEALRAMPMFAGIRTQVGRLHREAEKIWRKCNPAAQPLEPPGRLPIMTKLPIYAVPPETVLTFSRDYTKKTDSCNRHERAI
ncbi:hypothetical protein [Paraburkholderia aromaticivorans]|uniref:hypothetical protein n=1 Tax=Paraburkholderia aromaticivorans TaxID=2026199 RepID=UPI001455EF81|nr:hypothetical protein [Paraburkholderia aromaticivorans]